MSQIRKLFLFVIPLFLAVLSLAGCGDNNAQTNFDPDQGAHASGWLPLGHLAAVRAHGDAQCTDCHGSTFDGGIAKVSCVQIGCHLGSHTQIHPVPWYAAGETAGPGALAYAAHGPFLKQRNNDSSFCNSVFCHGANLQGTTDSGPSCTSCHLGDAFHVHPWASDQADFAATPIPLHGQYVGANGTSACRNAVCHGASLQGVFLSGPACSSCHANLILP